MGVTLEVEPTEGGQVGAEWGRGAVGGGSLNEGDAGIADLPLDAIGKGETTQLTVGVEVVTGAVGAAEGEAGGYPGEPAGEIKEALALGLQGVGGETVEGVARIGAGLELPAREVAAEDGLARGVAGVAGEQIAAERGGVLGAKGEAEGGGGRAGVGETSREGQPDAGAVLPRGSEPGGGGLVSRELGLEQVELPVAQIVTQLGGRASGVAALEVEQMATEVVLGIADLGERGGGLGAVKDEGGVTGGGVTGHIPGGEA